LAAIFAKLFLKNKEPMKAIITVGISASGKSTFAKEWLEDSGAQKLRVEINRDAFREQILKEEGIAWSWEKWNWDREPEVTERATKALEDAIAGNYDIICSDTNLNKEYRDRLVKKLKWHGYEVEIKEFPISLEDAIARDYARAHSVGEYVIKYQYKKWLEYKGELQ
jgi:predicted kinase